MASRITTVTEYMHAAPEPHLDALIEIREICLQTLQGYKESMEFGMPSYSHDGQLAVTWASIPKDGIQVQIFNDEVLKKFKPLLKHVEITKSTIRFKQLDQEDYALLRQMLAEISSQHNPAPSDH